MRQTTVFYALYYGLLLLMVECHTTHSLEENGRLDENSIIIEQNKIENEKRCRIYMAPTSGKGMTGFGIYTTQPIREGEAFLQGPDGPSIPVFDYQNMPDSNEKGRKTWIDVFDNYWWGRGVSDQVSFEAERAMDFQITFGSLPNHHCVLVGFFSILEWVWGIFCFPEKYAQPCFPHSIGHSGSSVP